MPAKAGIQSEYLRIQVTPFRIGLFNQLNLPGPFPFLDRLFPRDGSLHGLVYFVPHQRMYSVAFRESFDGIVFVLPDTLNQV